MINAGTSLSRENKRRPAPMMDTRWRKMQRYNTAINQGPEVLSTSKEPEIPWLEMAILGSTGSHPSFITGGNPGTNRRQMGGNSPWDAQSRAGNTTRLTTVLDPIAEGPEDHVMAEAMEWEPTQIGIEATPGQNKWSKESMPFKSSAKSDDVDLERWQRIAKESTSLSKTANPLPSSPPIPNPPSKTRTPLPTPDQPHAYQPCLTLQVVRKRRNQRKSDGHPPSHLETTALHIPTATSTM